MREERQKILIIDDTPENIQILNEMLQSDYAIFFASNGRDGIRIAQRETPDLILLDIMMPEMDGYEVSVTPYGSVISPHVTAVRNLSSSFLTHSLAMPDNLLKSFAKE